MTQQELFKNLTSSAEASPANRSVSQANKKARKTIDTSGHTCMQLLNQRNPLGSLSKTLVASSMWHSMMCVLTWKPKVTPRNRLLFQLAVSKLPTKETESGSSESLWPTPTTQEIEHPEAKLTKTGRRLSKDGKNSHSLGLADQVTMWPTPRATERMGYYEQPSPSMIKGTHGWSLPAAVTDEASEESHRMWPTPNSSPATASQTVEATQRLRASRDRKQGILIEAVVDRMWPTPRAANPGSRPNGKGGKILNEEVLIAEGLRTRGEKMFPASSQRLEGHRGEHGLRGTSQEEQTSRSSEEQDVPNPKELRNYEHDNGERTQQDREHRVSQQPRGERGFEGTKQDVADTERLGQQGQGELERPGNTAQDSDGQTGGSNDGRQGSTGQGHTQSELGGVADGIPTRLDGHLGFEREPNIPRVATGIPDRVNRLKALGNSIVPQIVYNIGLAILEEEKRNERTL
jgi:hypothetical protein